MPGVPSVKKPGVSSVKLPGVPFVKMHGLGNDFILVSVPLADPSGKAVAWCDRHTGIGADCLVLLGPSEVADVRMRIFNADGSEVQMCGNAARCVGKFLYGRNHGKTFSGRTEYAVETLSGVRHLQLYVNGPGEVEEVTVGMGKGSFLPVCRPDGGFSPLSMETVEVEGVSFCGTAIDVGNPHIVLFVDDVEAVDVAHYGPLIEHLPLFPEKANVEFARVLDRQTVCIRVWERGCGQTKACGTGACATVVAAVMAGRTESRNVRVIMEGGSLKVSFDTSTADVEQTGPATFVFEGTTYEVNEQTEI